MRLYSRIIDGFFFKKGQLVAGLTYNGCTVRGHNIDGLLIFHFLETFLKGSSVLPDGVAANNQRFHADYINFQKAGIVSAMKTLPNVVKARGIVTKPDNHVQQRKFVPTNCISEFVQRVLVQFKNAVVNAVLRFCPGRQIVSAVHPLTFRW